jgi:hypothetical protein
MNMKIIIFDDSSYDRMCQFWRGAETHDNNALRESANDNVLLRLFEYRGYKRNERK